MNLFNPWFSNLFLIFFVELYFSKLFDEEEEKEILENDLSSCLSDDDDEDED